MFMQRMNYRNTKTKAEKQFSFDVLLFLFFSNSGVLEINARGCACLHTKANVCG